MVVATIDLAGRFAHNRAVRTNPKRQQFSRRELQVEAARRAVTQRFLHNLDRRLGVRAITTPEMATEFTRALLDAARTALPKEERRRRTQGWCETLKTRAARPFPNGGKHAGR